MSNKKVHCFADLENGTFLSCNRHNMSIETSLLRKLFASDLK